MCARPFLPLSLARDRARVAGSSAERLHWVMMGAVALTVIVSSQAVGILLVFGTLAAPPATPPSSRAGWAA